MYPIAGNLRAGSEDEVSSDGLGMGDNEALARIYGIGPILGLPKNDIAVDGPVAPSLAPQPAKIRFDRHEGRQQALGVHRRFADQSAIEKAPIGGSQWLCFNDSSDINDFAAATSNSLDGSIHIISTIAQVGTEGYKKSIHSNLPRLEICHIR